MIGNKWHLFDKVADQLEALHDGTPEHYQPAVEGLINRLGKNADLKGKLDEEEFLLKKEYMMLLKERSLYASKLNDIMALGDNLDWN